MKDELLRLIREDTEVRLALYKAVRKIMSEDYLAFTKSREKK